MLKRTTFIAICFFALTMMGCNYSYDGFEAYFWTSSPEFESKHLVIDGVDKGVLPLLPAAPVCDDMLTKQQALHLPLPSGKYRLEIKDKSGKTGYAETLKIKRRGASVSISSSTNGKRGGSRSVVNSDCFIAEFYTK